MLFPALQLSRDGSGERRPTVPQRPGKGTRVTVNALGSTTNGRPGKSLPGLRFRPLPQGNRIGFTRGLVELREPTIHGKPMSTETLALSPGTVNEKGESWVCVEITGFSENGRINDETKLELVQVADPLYFTPELARLPLALLLYSGNRLALVDHITQWNARYYRLTEGSTVRHLFL